MADVCNLHTLLPGDRSLHHEKVRQAGEASTGQALQASLLGLSANSVAQERTTVCLLQDRLRENNAEDLSGDETLIQ